MESTLLTWITFTPLIGAAPLVFFPKTHKELIKWWSLGVTLFVFALSIPLFFWFDPSTHEMQFVHRAPWIPRYGITYFVGIDGISLFLVLLTTVFMPICVIASFRTIEKRVKQYYFSLLLLETGLVGVFIAVDLFLFYIFWEAMLIPMYLLIGIWGGPRRVYAAVKFFLYTLVGSLLMLVAILALYFLSGTGSYSLLDLYSVSLAKNVQMWMFLAFAVAFAIKVPMFPFHTWLPDAHVEAPTAGSVILAAILLKMGTYGFIRFAMPLFPYATAQYTTLIMVLGIIGIIYGALVAMVQPDIKKLVAYSSVSHLGFVMIGLFALNSRGVEGAVYQMLNHGVSTGALFLLVGIIYDKTHTRMISDYGGLTKLVPIFSAFFMIITMSSIGLPGLNGFVGEFLILVGSFQVHAGYGVFAALGVILSACYMLWMVRRVFFGPAEQKPHLEHVKDMSIREIAYMLPIILLVFWMGLYPGSFLRKMDASVEHTIQLSKGKRTAVAEYTYLLPEDFVARPAASARVMSPRRGESVTRPLDGVSAGVEAALLAGEVIP